MTSIPDILNARDYNIASKQPVITGDIIIEKDTSKSIETKTNPTFGIKFEQDMDRHKGEAVIGQWHDENVLSAIGF